MPTNLKPKPFPTQFQGEFDGKPSAGLATARAVVVVTTLDKKGAVVDACNGVQYAPGLIATNDHCFAKPFASVAVDFGFLSPVAPDIKKKLAPDYHGEFRCAASRDSYRASAGVDVAVVRVAETPADFSLALAAFDPQGGTGKLGETAPAYLTHYWLDPDLSIVIKGKETKAVHLTKYDQAPPSCRIYWGGPSSVCEAGQIIHYCDTGRGSSGSPVFGATLFEGADMRGEYAAGAQAIALHAGGIPDRGNCAVPAALFAAGLPKQ